jgi:RNA recognition motif-containing protein
LTGIEGNYKKDEKVVYVTGFDKNLPFIDLENFMRKYGEVVQVIRHQDDKGRSKAWVFVEYKTPEDAEKAIMDSGRANIMGRKLQINYKISRVKVLEDRDCWFCIDNPKIEKHLIIKQAKNFYSALPKGPVCDEHFLIIPNKHIAHSLELDDA